MIKDQFINDITSTGASCTPDSPMKEHTSFKIGGPADYYITVNNIEELKGVITLCKSAEVPYMLLGNGSNLLVSDEGLRMAVIRL
ncbi:MAG: hypothetical protein II225_04555, partial [Ruminococcus sp.]|nr:hypothetical protein [Ruminococcus sp.]